MDELHFPTRAAFRAWLSKNHSKSKGFWMIFYKVGTGKPQVRYDDAVEEALCFGWIDSIIKGVDGEKFLRKFTPRSNPTNWSPSNVERARKMIAEGKMTKHGLAVFKPGKAGADRPLPSAEMTPETKRAFRDAGVIRAFERLPPSHRRRYLTWLNDAKRPETRERRLREVVEALRNGEALGLK
ncbi:MAG: YdeI/OmpD-associated family protein [Methanobacteriota archaeon]